MAASSPPCSVRFACCVPPPTEFSFQPQPWSAKAANSYVFASKGNGHFERRTVTLGRAVDGSLEILSGINPGDTIVSQGALLLRDAQE